MVLALVGGLENKDRPGEIGMFDVNFEFEHHRLHSRRAGRKEMGKG